MNLMKNFKDIENLENLETFDEIDENNKEEKDEIMDLVFVLDMSGSMYDLTEDTIGGFNSLIKKEKEADANTRVTLVLFNTEFKVIHNRKAIGEVEELTSDVYCAYGCTALLDAVGNTINSLNRKTSGKVLFVISTDGLENASREFSRNNIKNLISNHDWEFLFLGANIDSFKEAGMLGIDASRTANYKASSNGVNRHWRSLSIASRSVSDGIDLDDGHWKEELEK